MQWWILCSVFYATYFRSRGNARVRTSPWPSCQITGPVLAGPVLLPSVATVARCKSTLEAVFTWEWKTHLRIPQLAAETKPWLRLPYSPPGPKARLQGKGDHHLALLPNSAGDVRASGLRRRRRRRRPLLHLGGSGGATSSGGTPRCHTSALTFGRRPAGVKCVNISLDHEGVFRTSAHVRRRRSDSIHHPDTEAREGGLAQKKGWNWSHYQRDTTKNATRFSGLSVIK